MDVDKGAAHLGFHMWPDFLTINLSRVDDSEEAGLKCRV